MAIPSTANRPTSNYWVKPTSYPSRVQSGSTVVMTLDWEAGYGEWLVQNAEPYFKFIIAGEEALVTEVFHSDGPAAFDVPIPAGLDDGQVSMLIEMWDEDIIFDDQIANWAGTLTIDASADPDGEDWKGDLSGYIDWIASNFHWVILGIIVFTLLIAMIMGLGINTGVILVTALFGAFGYLVKAFWVSGYALWVGLLLALVPMICIFVYPEMFDIFGGALSSGASSAADYFF